MKTDLKMELGDQAWFEVNSSGGPFGDSVIYCNHFSTLTGRGQGPMSTSMPTVSVWQMTIKVKLEIPWICKWQKYAKIKIKKVERIITFYPMFLGNTVRTRTSKPPPSWTRKLAPPQQQLLWCPSSEWKHFCFSRLSRWTLWSQLTTLCLSQINA